MLSFFVYFRSRQSVMKNKIGVGIIGALVVSNIVVGYEFGKSFNEKNRVIEKQDIEINRLLDINDERNLVIESQLTEINTYKIEVGKLQTTVKERNSEIVELEKQLERAKKKQQNSP